MKVLGLRLSSSPQEKLTNELNEYYRIAEENPDDNKVHLRIAEVLMKMGEKKKAIEEYLYPATANCVTDNMSYANDVWPVISSSCTGCHSGVSPAGGIALENYTDVSGAAAIQPGNYGSLYGAISHASGNSPMPKNGNKLSDCTIAKIKAWIDQGMLEN